MRGAIMARYAIMSFSPKKARKACINCEVLPPDSTTCSNARAANSTQCHVSPNALIWDAAWEPSFSAKRTL